MKKEVSTQVRMEAGMWSEFGAACSAHGVKKAVVMRDLCTAAIAYMAKNCPKGRWIPPTLIPFNAAVDNAGNITQREVQKVANSSRIPLLPTK